MNEHHDIKEHLPLAHLAYYILLTLAGGDMSPAELSAAIGEQTGGAIRCARAEVTGMIRKLQQREYVEDSPLQPDPENHDEHRRSYTLTMLGMRVAAAETVRIAGALRLAVENRLVSREQLRTALPRAVLG